MKTKKQLLSRLMALDNKEADKQLAAFGNELKNTIAKSMNNDEVFENLELLEQFIYKVPKTAIEIIKKVVSSEYQTHILKTDFGDLEGKTYVQLIIKSLELLNRLRYIATDDVINILPELIANKEQTVKTKAIETLKHLSQYDYSLLTKTKLGYAVQREVLDFILNWSAEERLKNFDFVETATRELLSSSVEGASVDLVDTLTMHFAAVQPTDFLKDLRKETINLIYELYKQTDDSYQKLRLVKILEEAVQTPSNVAYGEDLSKMISETGQYLIAIYRKMIFDGNNQIICPFAIIEEVDKRLYWQQKHNLLNSSEAIQLRKDILADKLYAIVKLLVGDDIVYREEMGWDDAEEKRSNQIKELIESINNANIAQWIQDLNNIANEKGLINEWQYMPFKQFFIKQLAIAKPELASKIIEDAFNNQRPLLKFLDNFLIGFRTGGHLKYWDQFVKITIKKHTPDLISAIAYSLFADRNDPVIKLRSKDLKLLEDLVLQQKEFAFLKDATQKNYILRHAVSNALVSQHANHPSIIENLIAQEVSLYPEYDATHIQTFSFGIHGNKLDFSKWKEQNINTLKQLLIRLPNLEWHSEELLVVLGKLNINNIFDIFYGRMEYDEKRNKKRKNVLDYSDRYDAIPYDINPDLKKFVSTHPDTPSILQRWLSKTTTEWSTYNWNVGHLIQRIGVSLQTIIQPLIEKGDEKSLKKAVLLMSPFNGTDVDLCMSIIGKTDNKEIISHLRGQFFSTGVVSGEYGIAEAHEAMAKRIENFKNDSNPRISAFAEKTIKELNESAIRERKQSDEEKQLRKLNFEE